MENIDLMTAAEAAKALRLTRGQIYAAAASLQVPSLRIGRRLRFSRAQLAEWIAEQTTQTATGEQAGREMDNRAEQAR